MRASQHSALTRYAMSSSITVDFDAQFGGMRPTSRPGHSRFRVAAARSGHEAEMFGDRLARALASVQGGD